MLDYHFKEFGEHKVVTLFPFENDPDLIFNLIFSVNTDLSLDQLPAIWILLLLYLTEFKIKVFGSCFDLYFECDNIAIFINNLDIFVDNIFNNEKQVVSIILSLEMSPLEQPWMIVFCLSTFFYKFASFFFYVSTFFASKQICVLCVQIDFTWLLTP